MVQLEERLTARISFYTKPSIDERLDKVVAASLLDKPDWLRHWLEDTLVRLETEELLGEVAPDTDVADAPLAVQVATALAHVAGLERVNGLLTERLGMADAQNIELNKRLERHTQRWIGPCSRCQRHRETVGLRGEAGSSGGVESRPSGDEQQRERDCPNGQSLLPPKCSAHKELKQCPNAG